MTGCQVERQHFSPLLQGESPFLIVEKQQHLLQYCISIYYQTLKKSCTPSRVSPPVFPRQTLIIACVCIVLALCALSLLSVWCCPRSLCLILPMCVCVVILVVVLSLPCVSVHVSECVLLLLAFCCGVCASILAMKMRCEMSSSQA